MRNWTPKPTLRPTSRPISGAKLLHASPPVVLIVGFLALIFVGTFLLYLPFSQNGEISLFQAFFTATSAVTVTGLSVIDPGTQLTGTGQTILMLLIQLGGLGFATFAVISAVTLGKRMSLENADSVHQGCSCLHPDSEPWRYVGFLASGTGQRQLVGHAGMA